MKFHKLVKSIDYATYPVLVELRKINKVLGDSLSGFRDILITSIVAVLLDVTPLSQWIVGEFCGNSTCAYLVKFSRYADADKFIAIFLAGLFYCVLWLRHCIKARWGSNMNTINERKEIAFKFYKVIIPNLISLKSIIEQADASIADEDKKVLLLFQAKHELEELVYLLTRLEVVEVDAQTNILTKNSKDVLDQIGQDAYFAVLIDIIGRVNDVYSKLKNCSSKHVQDTLASIKTLFFSARVLSVHSHVFLNHPLSSAVKEQYEKVKKEMSKESCSI